MNHSSRYAVQQHHPDCNTVADMDEHGLINQPAIITVPR